MTSFSGRNWIRIRIVCIGIGASLTLCGCVVGNKGFQMDSISKMPWFNLEFRERKKPSDGPAFRSVRSDNGTRTRVDTLGLSGAKADPSASVETATTLPRKAATSLPTTDRSLALDSTASRESAELDFR